MAIPFLGGDEIRVIPEPDPSQLPLATTDFTPARPEPWTSYVIGFGLVAYGIMVVFGVGSGAFELVEAIPLVPILGYATYRLSRRIARTDDDPSVVRFLMAAFAAKLLGTLIRAAVVAWVYGNRSDALDYHRYGQALAPAFRRFDFSAANSWSGTGFMRSFTGIIYAFTGASKVSGAIVMSYLSFLGGVFLWRAFRRAVPDGLTRRYGILVLFLPSLLYWPSALGKEGWALFCLGIASYGVARVTTGRIPSGVLWFAAGIGGITLLRPHVALTMFAGVTLAGLVGKSRKPGGGAGLLRIALFGALFVMFIALASSTAQFFGVDSLNTETINKTLADAEGRTSEAGSKFSPVNATNNPALLPLAFVTVLFRPLPIEATSGVAAASALEGVFLMYLTYKSLRRLKSLPRSMRRYPFVAYCVGITFTFVYAFSAFSNFGILARERCQVLPFFLALLCLPEWNREGVITIEEAVRGRDEVVPIDDVVADDPYAEPSDVQVRVAEFDPYQEAADSSDIDPYAPFREG